MIFKVIRSGLLWPGSASSFVLRAGQNLVFNYLIIVFTYISYRENLLMSTIICDHVNFNDNQISSVYLPYGQLG